MLTAEQTAIVKATVPLLETGGEALTTHFYTVMLSEYAQVRPLFNQAHQAHGTQPRALANAVLQYARHIDNLGALGSLARADHPEACRAANPARTLPDWAPAAAPSKVLGEEIATDAVIAAWGEAYWQLANILIGAEAAEYERLAAAPGGWRGAPISAWRAGGRERGDHLLHVGACRWRGGGGLSAGAISGPAPDD
jgi:nitric oxide dioxygenase